MYDLCGAGSDKKKSGDRGKGLEIRGGETGINVPGLSCNVVTDIDQVGNMFNLQFLSDYRLF